VTFVFVVVAIQNFLMMTSLGRNADKFWSIAGTTRVAIDAIKKKR
jgi:hypothetical protein